MSQKSEPDQAYTLVFAGIVLFGFFWLIWHFFKQPILETFRWVRYAEMWVLNIVVPHYDDCLHWLAHARFGDTHPSSEMIGWTNSCFTEDFLRQAPPEETMNYYSLSGDSMAMIGRDMASYYRWPVVLLLGFFSYYAWFLSPRNKFKTKHTLETFIRTQADMWPVISPIVNFNPIESSARAPGDMVPDKLPLFAEALSPEEFISFHRIGVTNNIPDRDATRRAFLLQLGPRWNGSFSGLPIYMKALVAACALKGMQKRQESDDLLGQISTHWSAKGGLQLPGSVVSEIEKIVRDEKLGAHALAVANKHAYRTTAMVEMLRWARSRGGVLAPAQFLWLRGVDRNLWYALNNLGRRAYLMEGAGAMAHFMAEQNAHKPLPIPRIDTAIVALNQYMAEKGLPIPPRQEAAS